MATPATSFVQIGSYQNATESQVRVLVIFTAVNSRHTGCDHPTPNPKLARRVMLSCKAVLSTAYDNNKRATEVQANA